VRKDFELILLQTSNHPKSIEPIMAERIAKIKEDSSTSNKDELRWSTSFYAYGLYSERQSNPDIIIPNLQSLKNAW